MRVAIVNDMALAREALRRVVTAGGRHSVAWTAVDGEQAVAKASADHPDAVLMDLIMPVTDGVEATRRIMAVKPCAILVVTSSVTGNFAKVYAAMGHGALDAINTPVLGTDGSVEGGVELLARLEKIERALRHGIKDPTPAVPHWHSTTPSNSPPMLVLGASTGGPDALGVVLKHLPKPLRWPVLVVQHIAEEFAPSLAEWLCGQSGHPVSIARSGDRLMPGKVLLASSNDHLIVRDNDLIHYTPVPTEYPYRPSVDVAMASLVGRPGKGVAVLLTGMGADGAHGLLRLKQAGWTTIAQDRATSVVYGMPKAAADLGAATMVLPLPDIAGSIASRIGRR